MCKCQFYKQEISRTDPPSQILCHETDQFTTALWEHWKYYILTLYNIRHILFLSSILHHSQYLKLYSISSIILGNVLRKTMKNYIVITSIAAKNETEHLQETSDTAWATLFANTTFCRLHIGTRGNNRHMLNWSQLHITEFQNNTVTIQYEILWVVLMKIQVFWDNTMLVRGLLPSSSGSKWYRKSYHIFNIYYYCGTAI
jgi:hypothetical protein